MIAEFEKACSLAFDKLSHFNSVNKVKTKKSLGFEKYTEVWIVTSEIEIAPNTPEDFDFYICFKGDFPLSFPWIYLSQKD